MDLHDNLFDKKYFPTLKSNPELLYFDSAATTHTHKWVVDRMNKFYNSERCTVHRSDGAISDRIAEEMELSRSRIANLINASSDQILFTTGATQGLNWIADWYKNIGTVIITEAEHNANVLPWIAQGRKIGNGLEVLPLDYSQSPSPLINVNKALDIFNKCQGNALLSLCSHSNVLGTAIGYAPQHTLLKEAKSYGITTCLDACQTIGHLPVDVETLDADWVVFSGHKMYGPMGIGVLYHRGGTNNLRPINFGGGQVEHMSLTDIVFSTGSYKHEVGTPNIPGILGLGLAAELINYVGYDSIIKHESIVSEVLLHELSRFDMECISSNRYQTILGQIGIPATQSIFSYVTKSHPSDIGLLLSQHNVSVRSGKLCAHLIANQFSEKGLLRFSIAPYNTVRECHELSSILNQVFEQLY